MDKLTIIIATKCMPVTFLVDDHPVYVLVALLKDENTNKYCDIVPFLGPFQMQRVMMIVIYKRYTWNELGEVIVAESSVDRALKANITNVGCVA